MMPTTRTYVLSGPQDPIILDFLPTSDITAAVTITGGGSAEWLLQTTLDNVFEPTAPDYVTPADARWHRPDPLLFDATGFVNFPGPWRAIRLNLAALTAPVVFQVGQATTPMV